MLSDSLNKLEYHDFHVFVSKYLAIDVYVNVFRHLDFSYFIRRFVFHSEWSSYVR